MSPEYKRTPTVLKVWFGLAILFSLVGAFFIVGPAGRIPLMDANRTMLAETAAQGYCAAEAHFGRYSQIAYDECVADSTLSQERDLGQVQPAFCRGVIDAGWPGTMEECRQILEGEQMWPTAELTSQGYLTKSWNRKFPYPGSLIGMGSANVSESRTGDRDGEVREGGLRGDEEQDEEQGE